MVRHAKTFEVTATRGKANAVLSASDGSGGKKTFKFDKLAIERNADAHVVINFYNKQKNLYYIKLETCMYDTEHEQTREWPVTFKLINQGSAGKDPPGAAKCLQSVKLTIDNDPEKDSRLRQVQKFGVRFKDLIDNYSPENLTNIPDEARLGSSGARLQDHAPKQKRRSSFAGFQPKDSLMSPTKTPSPMSSPFGDRRSTNVSSRAVRMASLGSSGTTSSGDGSGSKRKRPPIMPSGNSRPTRPRCSMSPSSSSPSPNKSSSPPRHSHHHLLNKGKAPATGGLSKYGSKQPKITSRDTWGGASATGSGSNRLSSAAQAPLRAASSVASSLAWSMSDHRGMDRRRGVREGFRNSGNSCYVNAVLQVLMAQRLFSQDLRRNNSLPGSFYSYVNALVETFKKKNHEVIDVKDLKDAIGTRYPRFAGNAQQDAHEFFSEFINHLNDDLCDSLKQRWQQDHPTLSLQKALTAAASSASSSGASSASALAPIQLSESSSSSSSSSFPSTAAGKEHTQFMREVEKRRARARRNGTLTEALSEDIHKELASLLDQSPTSLNFKSQVEWTYVCTKCQYKRSMMEGFHDFSLDIVDPAALQQLERAKQRARKAREDAKRHQEELDKMTDEEKSNFSGPRKPPQALLLNGNGSGRDGGSGRGSDRVRGDASPRTKRQMEKLLGWPECREHGRARIYGSSTKQGKKAGKNFIMCTVETCTALQPIWFDEWKKKFTKPKSGAVPPLLQLNKKLKNAGQPDLSRLLHRFFQPRTLEYKCSECDCTTVEVTGKMKALPRVLVLHLKRFLPNLAKGTYDKNRDRVRFPTKLDLKDVCTPQTFNPPAVTVEKTLQSLTRASRKPKATLNGVLGYPNLKQKMEGECTSAAELEKLWQELEEEKFKLAKYEKQMSLVVNRHIDPRKAEQQQMEDVMMLSQLEAGVQAKTRRYQEQKEKLRLQGLLPTEPRLASSPSSSGSPGSPGTKERKNMARAIRQSKRDSNTSQRREQENFMRAVAMSVAESQGGSEDEGELEDDGGSGVVRQKITEVTPARYTLCSIVLHKGHMAQAGHYVADVLDHKEGTWRRYDDQFVSELKDEQATGETSERQGYMFFYVNQNLLSDLPSSPSSP